MEIERLFFNHLNPDSTMEERPGRPGPKKRAQPTSSRELGRLKRGSETGECCAGCSGQSCRSCSAALVADCVALCCCPLAFVSLIGLAFIKVPCAMGKRCLGRSKRKEKKKVCVGRKQSGKEEDFGVRNASAVLEIVEAEAIEADNVLLEMYELGHLGFGTVSCTETQPSCIGD